MRHDLLELLPATTAARERGTIDLGSPDGDALLLAGWAAARTLDDGTSVVVPSSRRTTLRVALDGPAERVLRVRAAALRGEARAAGRPLRAVPVVVSLNRRRLGILRVGEALAEHELALPARFQATGDNLLTFEHPTLPPAGRGRSSVRDTIAYDRVEIARSNGAHEARPSVSRDGAGIVLPVGRELDYFLRAPAQGQLRFALAPPPGAEPAALRVVVARDATDERTIFTGAASAGDAEPVVADLGTEAGALVRLSFRASGRGAVRLLQPAVLGAPDGRPREGAAVPDSPGGATRPNVLLYVIDTLRADHLGCYGYARPTSPHIDAFAREGVLFTRAVAQASWTRPSVASILSGLPPRAHGASTLRHGLRADVPLLPELLRDAGYATAAFVTNVNVSGAVGFARGFDTFTYLPEKQDRPSLHVPSDELNRAALEWLAQRPARPFFLYMHASDPHAPYTASPEDLARVAGDGGVAAGPAMDDVRRALERASTSGGRDAGDALEESLTSLRAAYDAEIAFNDASFGHLLAELDRLGLRDDTLVVLTSDHGEEFGDHGALEHGHTLFEELIHVPLVVRLPGARLAGERHTTIARHVDVLPTVLAAVGVRAPAALTGRALLAPDDAAREEIEALSETSLGPNQLAALVTERWKVVDNVAGPRQTRGLEVYDLAHDPNEQANVARAQPLVAGYGRQALHRAAAAASAAEAAAPAPQLIDRETELKLRALGYTD